MDDIRAMFLRQSMKDSEAVFLNTVGRRDALSWDYLVITAANEAQAGAYRAQIDRRLAAGLLPGQTKYLVIPDPDGKRVGSGGATLNALRRIALLEGGETPFAMKRVLVLHSGGDSRRIPQYSAVGKLFARVPRPLWDGRASTLFDEFLLALACVPARMSGGMLVMSGDVLLLFNALQIDLERSGAACLSIKAPAETGTRHGVFLSDGNGGVKRFLHKQDLRALQALGAVNAQGMVDIDTGAIWMDEARVNALYGLVKTEDAFARFVNDRTRLNFYGDFVYPMASDATLEGYLREKPENAMSDEVLACRRAVYRAIGGTDLSLIRLSPAEFIHFGTTGEWLALMNEGPERFGFLGWRRSVMSLGASPAYTAVNSLIDPGAAIGAGSAIEDSHIRAGAVIGEGCVVSGADFAGELDAGRTLHVLPVLGGAYCARAYGVSENPKEGERWRTPAHPVRRSAKAAADAALTEDQAPPRMSLQESFEAADLDAILAWQQSLTDKAFVGQVSGCLLRGDAAEDVAKMLPAGFLRTAQAAMLKTHADTALFPLKHRLFALLAMTAKAEKDASALESMENACWNAVHEHVVARLAAADAPVPRIARERSESRLPVRVNWGGGWTDTPPYCLEHGGAVLNASMLLCGTRPVFAAAERLDTPVIRIQSDDLGLSRDYTRLEALAAGNPRDPHALCKAALQILGVVPRGAFGDVAERLAAMGGGILLRTSVSHVPKGSGLGTSSILCAAVARALSGLLGLPDGDEHIAALTLGMEQLMNTGGGWQDQVGGLLPGIKLTTSRPGTPQKLVFRRVNMPEESFSELSRRYVLVFTGQRRMARNLLREIMGKVTANHPDTLSVLREIRRLAVLMAFELEAGDVDEFAKLLREHWALSKRLDAGSTNTCIDAMLTVCGDLIDAAMICGAGGGGFMGMILKNEATKEKLGKRLASVFQESGVKVWDAELER